MMSLTAFWQAGDSLAMFFSKHISASLPPGETLMQFAM